MELIDAMRTQHACRYYTSDDVPDAVLYEAVDSARFGPQGGNRQPVNFLIVKDPSKKKALAELYIVPWREYMQANTEAKAVATKDEYGTEKATWTGHTNAPKAFRDADHFAEHFADHPAIIVVCADLAATHPTDTELGRLSVVGGASIYPTAQNLCLALRNLGVATTFTTLLCAYEKEVREILSIPEHLSTAAHIVAGYPAKPFPKRLHRRPVEEMAFVDSFDNPLSGEKAAATV